MAALLYSLGYVQKSVALCPVPGEAYFSWLIRGPKECLDISGVSRATNAEDVENKLMDSIERMNRVDEGPTSRWEIF